MNRLFVLLGAVVLVVDTLKYDHQLFFLLLLAVFTVIDLRTKDWRRIVNDSPISQIVLAGVVGLVASITNVVCCGLFHRLYPRLVSSSYWMAGFLLLVGVFTGLVF